MHQDPTNSPVPTPPRTPSSSPYSSRPANTKNTARKRMMLIISGIVALALIGLGVYAYMQMNDKNDQAATQDNLSQADGTDATNKAAMITTTLPNGKTAAYADTEANKNLSFSTSAMGDDYVDVSYKAIGDYLAAAEQDSVDLLCGANGEKAQIENIVVATMSTSVRAIEYPTENNCLDEFATLRNPDSASQTSASALIKQVDKDVREFYRTVIIK